MKEDVLNKLKIQTQDSKLITKLIEEFIKPANQKGIISNYFTPADTSEQV